MISKKQFRLLILCALISVCFTIEVAGQKIDFNTEIRPLLSNKCFACHGPDEAARAGDLQLNTRDGALDFAIDLNAPAESELFARITSDDEDLVMPPPSHGEPLSKEEAELILKWIQQGAPYAKHWSYEPPLKSQVPRVNGKVVNEIDHFVLSRLGSMDLQPALPADRYTLIRRVALDLTGLPPTLEEVEKFVSNQSETAYEDMVDDYLSRPTFGERWAAVWLDLARYADSAGYADDRKRTIWAYRDYVIKSYQQNKPFDQFTVEQIAGDLIPSSTEETKIATAFHRNTLTNSEGGTSDEEFRTAAVVDRVNTTMAVWMGTTMACAQCHTHKYDPITQKEYFQVYDFFNQTADSDRSNEAPVLQIFSEADLAKKDSLRQKIEDTSALKNSPVDLKQFKAWRKELRSSANGIVHGKYVRVDLPGKNKILSLAEVKIFSTNENGQKTNLALGSKATQSSTSYNGPPKLAIDGNTDGNFNKKSVTHTATEANPWFQIELSEPRRIEQISIWMRTDGNLFSRSNGYVVSVLDADKKLVWSEKYETASGDEQVANIQVAPPEILELVKTENELTSEQNEYLQGHFVKVRNAGIDAEVANLQSRLNSFRATTTVPVMEALSKEKSRTTKIQIRGNYLDTGETVTAAVPEAFHALPKNEPLDRLTLSKWLVSRDNPLTARVIVNRYWEQIFGVGIVSTSEEFGSQGELPSHPELLDWLAVDLMENGWDTKRLVKQMVMSATYRQSSVTSPEHLDRDPNNRFLARGPRNRLSAEMIRDQALAVSGLLSDKMYGRPVQPPQPKVGLKPAFSGQTTDWKDSVGEDRYRRGIYTEWRRSAPYASMATFDVGNREVCEIKRSNTNTPLQALVTLNDPVYVEAAQALARRIQNESLSDQEKAVLSFRLCLIRPPSDAETKRILELFRNTKAHFEDKPNDAKSLATDLLNPPAADTNMVELAAWTTVANVLLNLDEILMKP